ncbi:hypothetical protein A3A71_00160 [Candidatus Berkelbacteria bacterium RIFCSPLOWO2_01_FULL_50_28]|uniref:Uncharacterized protein n=1 Tax=Candidatus Berkelbacteria bacterium RIFCSPLOWO2_01_FULL_50_28 TaxID=1797471 RepID=A0A1F5EAQ8_9BACT|nr:MAG: hypothetical protein A2807_00090 [Candidatus Berkelbacteria bacterium RIFCSPHIGHO2_01_FULL_50_36]OGD62133.1 MAG: hypothetical protein A3F39_01725 [Candidatus Berkelbacteria bacterium RIFCSPHIGHO2_12_FULL_50_11]OGD64465.1 MAG: hypothetical protein A3A71_00160 [Candidatus Berkelbacteria bacterium RIFCSPLOWO2_01_FULL_50_28]
MYFLASGVPYEDTDRAATLLYDCGINFNVCSGLGNEAPMLCEGAERPERHVAIGLPAIARAIRKGLVLPQQESPTTLLSSQLATV